jgi:hypothetical protein
MAGRPKKRPGRTPTPTPDPFWWRGEQLGLPGMPTPPQQLTLPADQLTLPGLSRHELDAAELARVRAVLDESIAAAKDRAERRKRPA